MEDKISSDEVRERSRRLAAYHRRTGKGSYTRSSKWRRGTRANKHRRNTPTFASDRAEGVAQ